MEEKLTQEQLTDKLSKARLLVSVGSEYKHYKGDKYKVLDIAFREGNTEPYVVYEAQYGERTHFTRPVAEWVEEVQWQGETKLRFEIC